VPDGDAGGQNIAVVVATHLSRYLSQSSSWQDQEYGKSLGMVDGWWPLQYLHVAPNLDVIGAFGLLQHGKLTTVRGSPCTVDAVGRERWGSPDAVASSRKCSGVLTWARLHPPSQPS